MYIPFCEEFEYEFEDKIYYVQTTGHREIEVDGREYTELSRLVITDEEGNEVEEKSDVYLEIQEYAIYDREYEVEEHGFFNDWNDEELPYLGRR